MILVSAANNNGSDTQFIIGGGSITYVMNNRGSPFFIVPQLELKF
jgi:hypothetical protein